MSTSTARQQGTGFKAVLVLQAIIVVYTFSGVFGKLATDGHAFMSGPFILYVFLDIAVLGVYALLWQQALKRFELHVAYANRAMATVWGLIWAYLVFGEAITVMNIVGTALILAGTALVNSDAE
ncbi:MAG: EamA family transporter [Clostridia bacterium]|nr:EamA family transporter [Clostridia bacterium]